MHWSQLLGHSRRMAWPLPHVVESHKNFLERVAESVCPIVAVDPRGPDEIRTTTTRRHASQGIIIIIITPPPTRHRIIILILISYLLLVLLLFSSLML